jgi:hypothetical protein
MHFAVAGLLFAVIVPMLLLSIIVKHDPRVRMPIQIERDAGLPVLGRIPTNASLDRVEFRSKRMRTGLALFAAVPVLYGIVMILKLVDVL